MEFLQEILVFYNKILLLVPEDILYVSLVTASLFFILIIYEIYKFRKSKIKKNETYKLIEVEKKLKALKDLYDNGHIDISTYKHKTRELI